MPWLPDPDHRQWERWQPEPGDPTPWPAESGLERCPCGGNCVLTRHWVDVPGSTANPPLRALRYETFHVKAARKPPPARPERIDRRRLASGER